MLFALHPVQVESVAWVDGMRDVLSGLLSFVALWQYLAYARATSTAAMGSGEKERKAASGTRRSNTFDRRCGSILTMGTGSMNSASPWPSVVNTVRPSSTYARC